MVQVKSMRNILLVVALLIGLVANYTYSPASVSAASSSKPVPQSVHPTASPNFGSNVYIFDPSMTITQIQTTINTAYTLAGGNSESTTQRQAFLFKPGAYGSAAQPLTFTVGYYTEVAGLGQSPTDVVITGSISVLNVGGIALDNFWRSLSNLTINVAGNPNPGGGGCYNNTEFWAVSQAAPLRRVNINGGFTFMDYCTGPSYASGGFMSDSKATASVVSGSQQQFFVRDSQVGGWSNGVWNQVFAGVIGAPAQHFISTTNAANPYTTLATDPRSQEKPYLDYDAGGNYNVFVPALRTNSLGPTWSAITATAGITLPISSFFIAQPTDSDAAINSALAAGQNLIFTPGTYQVTTTLQVNNPDTIIIGMGMATLIPNGGITALSIGDVAGVKVTGLTFDAGTVNSSVLMQVGTSHGHGVATDPVVLSDVFFRIGGPNPGKATVALIVNTDYSILDDIWSWRADHGNGVGWTANTADTGLIVNGDNVLATGLFVEHYQKYNVIWNGENGETIFFQNELPYDPPTQAAWRAGPINGYAAYKVGDNVQNHVGYGLGSYIFMNVNPGIHATHAFEVPDHAGVSLHDMVTVSLNGDGVIDHQANYTGPTTNGGLPGNGPTNSYNLVDYPAAPPVSVTVTSNPNPSTVNQSVTFTATVSPSASGTVTFTDGYTVLGAATLSGSVATYTTSSLAVGSHLITGNYSGDINGIPVSSPAITQVVNLNSTAISLTSSPNPSLVGQNVTFTATLSPTAATGIVSFTIDSGAAIPVTVTSGVATYSTSALTAGSHSVVATYSGDSNYASATSVTLTQVVNFNSTAISLTSSPNPSVAGQTVTFTATVTPITATGTVTFSEGAAVLGTATLVSGTAVYTNSTLPVGSHVISATYGGDATYGSASSTTITQVVVAPCAPLVVTSITDDGTGTHCGTLSFALSQPVTATAASPITITFALTQGNTITFTGSLTTTAKIKANVTVYGGAFGTTNRIIINGNGVSGDGLHAVGPSYLVNLTIEHFGARELVLEGTGNRLQGVVVIAS